jgi:hypothetical protein
MVAVPREEKGGRDGKGWERWLLEKKQLLLD